MNEMDFATKADVQSSLRRVEELLGCGILAQEHMGNVLFRAAFVEILINMRDLMFKCSRYSERIAFDDDVKKASYPNPNGKGEWQLKDVSDLLKYVRDAICHPDSQNHYVDGGNIKFSFNVAFGSGRIMQTPDDEFTSDYDDDICFFFGGQKIYLKRHIVRAFEEAKAKLTPLADMMPSHLR